MMVNEREGPETRKTRHHVINDRGLWVESGSARSPKTRYHFYEPCSHFSKSLKTDTYNGIGLCTLDKKDLFEFPGGLLGSEDLVITY